MSPLLNPELVLEMWHSLDAHGEMNKLYTGGGDGYGGWNNYGHGDDLRRWGWIEEVAVASQEQTTRN